MDSNYVRTTKLHLTVQALTLHEAFRTIRLRQRHVNKILQKFAYLKLSLKRIIKPLGLLQRFIQLFIHQHHIKLILKSQFKFCLK